MDHPFIRLEGTEENFQMFGIDHLLVLVVISFIILCLYILRKSIREKSALKNAMKVGMAFLLLVMEAFVQLWFWDTGSWDVTYALPLHISSITLFLAVVVLCTRNKLLFELLFFIGFWSALFTLITPDLQRFAFPHVRFFHFFIAHGLILIVPLFMLWVENMRPRANAWWKVWLILNGYALCVFFVNIEIGSNYLYLMSKPAGTTFLDYFGSWPNYLFVLQLFILMLFMLWSKLYPYILIPKERQD
ncbi:TIGR02206 family membrane protein [Salsuginibacillus kocurii]|uniref:YwaF family protein n=1 Tax=Salsuginibacillus kocurii TaxID=427078 RepID=UPI00036BE2BC|nr:TIGR02206 family membrane protein [Salsuginibacillus kocurii]